MGEKVQGVRSVTVNVQNRQGEANNSMGNGEAKELMRTSHGHELKWGNDGGRQVQSREE